MRRRARLSLLAALGVVGCAEVDGAQTAATPVGLADTTLARLATEIQPAVERSAGMVADRPLVVAATDETRLRAYLEGQVTEQLSQDEAASITAAYARLGLVPADLDLQALYLALLEEQVVGYYDPRTDTLFVHERVTIEQLEPVLAHELVHALQDQQMALDSVTEALGDLNDASTAFQAATEGHATYAMMEWQFASMSGGQADLTTLPDLGGMLDGVDLSALGDVGPAEVLMGAPAVIREGLIFPYVGGLVFLQRLWKERPERPLPFGPNLPRSTEQVLHVERWLAGDAPTRVEFTDPEPGGSIVYERDLGELETRIFLEEHLGDRSRAERGAGGWDGDAIRLIDRGERGVLVWISVWDSADEADEFARAAGEAYTRRYQGEAGARQPRIERLEQADRPLVRIVDAPPGIDVSPAAAAVRLTGGEDTGARSGGP